MKILKFMNFSNILQNLKLKYLKANFNKVLKKKYSN